MTVPGGSGGPLLDRARPGDLGAAGRAAASGALESDVLGRAGPWAATGGGDRLPGAGPGLDEVPGRDPRRRRARRLRRGARRVHPGVQPARVGRRAAAAAQRRLPAWNDERMVRTVGAVREELEVDGLLLRYRTADGLDG